MSQSLITIKTSFEGDIRSFKTAFDDTEDTLNALIQFVISSYGFKDAKSFRMQYKDDEGDLITIVDSRDLEDANTEAINQNKKIKVFISAVKQQLRVQDEEDEQQAETDVKQDVEHDENTPKDLFTDIENNNELREEIVSFVEELITLYQKNKDSDLLTCIVTVLSGHDYKLLNSYQEVQQMITFLPIILPQIEPQIKSCFMQLDATAIGSCLRERLTKINECGMVGILSLFGPFQNLLPNLYHHGKPMVGGWFAEVPHCRRFKHGGRRGHRGGKCRRGRRHHGYHGHHGHHQHHHGDFAIGQHHGGICGMRRSNLRADIIDNPMPMLSNTMVDAEDKITKTWKMRNVGKFELPKGLKIKYCGRRNNDMVTENGDTFYVGNEDTIKVGDEFTVSISIKIPNNYGKYRSNWRLCTPDGKKFGQKLPFILILDPPTVNDVVKDIIVNLEKEENTRDDVKEELPTNNGNDDTEEGNQNENESENDKEEYVFVKELEQLESMGFKDQKELLTSLLDAHKGNLKAVLPILMD